MDLIVTVGGFGTICPWTLVAVVGEGVGTDLIVVRGSLGALCGRISGGDGNDDAKMLSANLL